MYFLVPWASSTRREESQNEECMRDKTGVLLPVEIKARCRLSRDHTDARAIADNWRAKED